MVKKGNTGLFIGIGIMVAGIALLLILPKRAKAQQSANPFQPQTGFGSVGTSPTMGGGSTEIGCGGGYVKTGFPLRRGSCGNEVAKLQAFLNTSGSYGLVVDGKFGQLTENAVKEEQSPFADFKSMYPNAIFGQITADYYNDFIA